MWWCRYETEKFFDQTHDVGYGLSCGNITSNATGLRLVVEQVISDIQRATPKTKGFYAATKTEVAGGSAIYAVAQCVETATEDTCQNCMQVGYNLQNCLPRTEGRAYDAGCFMRYSTTPFFDDNQTIDIAPFLKQGTFLCIFRSKWLGYMVYWNLFYILNLLLFTLNNADFRFIVFSFIYTNLLLKNISIFIILYSIHPHRLLLSITFKWSVSAMLLLIYSNEACFKK